MISKKMVSLISEQIKKEYESAYLYLEVADFYLSEGLSGFSNWFIAQSREEVGHAMMFYDYLHQNGERPVFYTLEPSRKEFTNLKKPLEESLHHEEMITSSVNQIYDLAEKEKDYRTKKFLNWFISEQQEEEESAMENIDKMSLYGGNPAGLFLLDKEMGKRCCESKKRG